MRVTILGCGGSAGVPLIGCDCTTCRSDNPKNKRSRVSIYIEINGICLLIDTSPDLRRQALKHHIRRVDAVLYTHAHADHTHGIDDLRSFNYLSDKPLDIYGDAHTISSLRAHFPYAFQPRPEKIWVRPCLVPHIFPDADCATVTVHAIPITLFKQHHGKGMTLGYRIGDFAYSTDTDQLPDAAYDALKGVQCWVVDCLRYTTSYSHSNLERTLEWAHRVRAKQTILTHMAHELEYDKLISELPPGIEPAYDGMVLEF